MLSDLDPPLSQEEERVTGAGVITAVSEQSLDRGKLVPCQFRAWMALVHEYLRKALGMLVQHPFTATFWTVILKKYSYSCSHAAASFVQVQAFL